MNFFSLVLDLGFVRVLLFNYIASFEIQFSSMMRIN